MVQGLETINLEQNNIGDQGARSLALALRQNTVIFIHVFSTDYNNYIFIIDCGTV